MAELENVLSIPRALRIFQRKRVPANCLSADVVGACVYVTGPKVGQRYQVATANPTLVGSMPAIGVIFAKASATVCTVQLFGEVAGIYSGFAPGATLYVGTGGQPSETPGPLAQEIGTALSDDLALISPALLVTAPHGAEIINCTVGALEGDCVYAVSSGTVDRIDPRVLSQTPSVGIIERKLSSTSCLLRTQGFMVDVYTGLSVQTQLWNGLDGRLTMNQLGITAAPGGKVSVQQMGIAVATNVVLVQPQRPYVRIG